MCCYLLREEINNLDIIFFMRVLCVLRNMLTLVFIFIITILIIIMDIKKYKIYLVNVIYGV